VEVGGSRGWDKLDPKAVKWSQFSGVDHILCVYLSPHLKVCQYKFHSVVNQAIAPPIMNATNIVNPTNLIFDSRRLLGHPPINPINPNARNLLLPASFSSPNLIVDVFSLVQRVIARYNGIRLSIFFAFSSVLFELHYSILNLYHSFNLESR
jgi:hypothetical protein